MNHTTHTEEFVKKLYTKLGILKPHHLNFRTIASQLGIHLFYWVDKSQALFLKN